MLGILLIMPNSLNAQTGAISGAVTDTLQNPVEYARISIIGATGADITDLNGSYSINNLPPGSYDLAVTRSDFHELLISNISVEQDSITELDIELLPSQFASLGGPTCMPGSPTWIPISITNTIAISEINLLLKWPADYLTAISILPDNRINYGNFSYLLDDAGPGTARIHWDAGAGSPMTGGSDPVVWLQVQPDTSLRGGDFVPVWFDGSQSDNAIFDSVGETLILDGYPGNSIFIYFDAWLPRDPDANGWPFDIGDLAIVTDRLLLGYIVWSRNGTGDDVFQEAAADLNGNGLVDIADCVIYSGLAQGYTTFGNYPILKFPPGVDPGESDAFSIGNLDGSSIVGNPGQIVEIPVYIKVDEDIRGLALRIMSDTGQIIEWLGVDSTSAFNWGFDVSNEIDYRPGYKGQTAIAVAASHLSFNTNGQWSDAIAYFRLRLADSGFTGGESIRLKGQASIVDSNYVVYQPVLIEGSILLEIPECDYVFGDANNDGYFNGLDVVYSVSYFKGFGSPPPTDCYCGVHGFYGSNADANGDCLLNGLDIVYSVSALKGTGPMPLGCPDCP